MDQHYLLRVRLVGNENFRVKAHLCERALQNFWCHGLVIKSASGQISPLTRVNPFNRFVRTESKHLVMMTRKTGMREITFSLLNLDTFNAVSVSFR